LGALNANTTGGGHTAIGYNALANATNSGAFGITNTAVGSNALFNDTTGGGNTALGSGALLGNTTGVGNTAVGSGAGAAATTGDNNVYIGDGMIGVAGEANHTYIRNIKDTSVSGSGTDTVTVNLTTGLLGHLTSSQRNKEDIKPMEKASEAIYRLKPVTYRYKKEIDSTQSPAFGLIAEQVGEVNPDLVAHNSRGQPESVHYEW
jgi:Chaperone of endosialidase